MGTSKKETSKSGGKRKAAEDEVEEANEYDKVPDEKLKLYFLPPTDEKCDSVTADELCSVLKSRGLTRTGSKRVLFDRLIDYLENIDKYKQRFQKAKKMRA